MLGGKSYSVCTYIRPLGLCTCTFLGFHCYLYRLLYQGSSHWYDLCSAGGKLYGFVDVIQGLKAGVQFHFRMLSTHKDAPPD